MNVPIYWYLFSISPRTKQHKLTINLFTFIIALSLKFDDAKLDKKIKRGSKNDLTEI